MMIKSTEELVIYESPDGGKTIYARNSGTSEREMIYQDPNKHYIARWYEWRDILKAAEDNVPLNDLIKQAEAIYVLTKE